MATENQIAAVARKIKDEVLYTIKIKGNANSVALRGIRICAVSDIEFFKLAREIRAEFDAAFYVKNEATACSHRMSDEDAWSAFKLAFPFDDMDYSHLGLRLKAA